MTMVSEKVLSDFPVSFIKLEINWKSSWLQLYSSNWLFSSLQENHTSCN